jgi:SAM-dependent methyltransferase
MLEAQRAGWSVEGIDPDPNAVRAAAEARLSVHATTVEEANLGASRYDAITLHHVIEHLPDPRSTLELCWRWLRPDGSLWLATPNVEAPGHAEYGAAWRGLDVPRHLVLFSATSLRALLESVGFSAVRFLPPARSRWIYEASASLGDKNVRPTFLRVRSFLQDLQCLHASTRGEELVVLARRGLDEDRLPTKP